MRVLVTGSRTWENIVAVRDALCVYPTDTVIVHGGARGADKIADAIARRYGFTVEVYPADWPGKGKQAGIIRNLAMLDSEPDIVIAFWDGQSSGTFHTITEAKRRGIPVEVIV